MLRSWVQDHSKKNLSLNIGRENQIMKTNPGFVNKKMRNALKDFAIRCSPSIGCLVGDLVGRRLFHVLAET